MSGSANKSAKRGVRAATPTLAVLVSAAFLVGCSTVVEATPEKISIDTGEFGEVMPGTRMWLSWLKANEHCAAQGRRPKLIDLRGSVAHYRCIDAE